MTGIGVFKNENGGEILEVAGDLSGKFPILKQFGLRVTLSDGTVFHFGFDVENENWKAKMLRDGNLLHDVESSNNKKTEYVIFKRGIKWAFAAASFFELMPDDDIKLKIRGGFVSAKTKELLDGQDDKRAN